LHIGRIKGHCTKHSTKNTKKTSANKHKHTLFTEDIIEFDRKQTELKIQLIEMKEEEEKKQEEEEKKKKEEELALEKQQREKERETQKRQKIDEKNWQLIEFLSADHVKDGGEVRPTGKDVMSVTISGYAPIAW